MLLMATMAGGCNRETPDSLLASAKDYLSKHDSAAATIQLKNALEKNPNLAEARFLLGRSFLESGDASAAEVELRKARDLKYPDEQVTPMLARALFMLGQYRKITEEFAKSKLSSADGLADLQTTLGQTFIALGKYDAAQEAFSAALVAKADYLPALIGQARLKAISADLPGANTIIDSVLTKDPRNAEAWMLKAGLLSAAANSDQAIGAYEKALEIKPNLLAAHAALIRLHIASNKLDLAVKQLELMKQAAPRQPLTLLMQSLVAYTQKNLPVARDSIQAMLKMVPSSPEGLQLAGLIEYENRSDLQAQEYLTKALQQSPDLGLARRILLTSYLRSNQPAKALSALQPVLPNIESAPLMLTLAGEVFLQNGDSKKAEEYFTKAAKLEPKNAQNRVQLALVHMTQGHADQGFTELEQIAQVDTGTSADMALIASSLQQRQFDKALKAIANLEKKKPDNLLVHNLRGKALLGKGDTAGARKSFEQALSKNPVYFPAVASLVSLDLAEHKPDEARKRLETLLSKDPNNLQALLALAELRARDGASLDEQAGLISKAVSGNPSDPAPRLALIGLYLRNKEAKKALSAAQEALAVLPDRPEILEAAGQAMQAAGDSNQALAIYGKLATLLPKAVQPYLHMAEIHLATKNKDAAREVLKKGLVVQPDSVPLQRAMIMLDVDAGRFPEALARAKEIQKQQPKEVIGYLLEGDVQVVRKSWTEAAAAYRAGLKLKDVTDLAVRLHIALIAGSQAAEADKLVDSWLKAHPKDGVFRLYLAETANRRKDYAAAIQQYRTMLDAQPNNPALLNNLAWALGQQRDPKAVGYAEQANKLAPNQPPLMDTLGNLLVERGEVDRGIDLLRKAVALAPQAAEIRLNLAKALIKSGQKAAAKTELEVLSKLGDKYPGQAEVVQMLKGL
ncbi:MAG TPA: XrtA/PEP-CTERM system TPR-repeat protein PrsT [Gallionella sp.]